jgi:hypothetical protein
VQEQLQLEETKADKRQTKTERENESKEGKEELHFLGGSVKKYMQRTGDQ